MLEFLWLFCLIYGQMVYFMAIWYLWLSFGTYFPVLVCCTEKNLATLTPNRPLGNELKTVLKTVLSLVAQISGWGTTLPWGGPLFLNQIYQNGL
jgi:hypothetical protein